MAHYTLTIRRSQLPVRGKIRLRHTILFQNKLTATAWIQLSKAKKNIRKTFAIVDRLRQKFCLPENSFRYTFKTQFAKCWEMDEPRLQAVSLQNLWTQLKPKWQSNTYNITLASISAEFARMWKFGIQKTILRNIVDRPRVSTFLTNKISQKMSSSKNIGTATSSFPGLPLWKKSGNEVGKATVLPIPKSSPLFAAFFGRNSMSKIHKYRIILALILNLTLTLTLLLTIKD